MKTPDKPVPLLPQKVRDLGVTQAQWERAHANPLVTSVTELAMALKISPKFLLPDSRETDKGILNLATLKPEVSSNLLDLSDSKYGRKFPYIELDLVDPNPFQNLVRTEYDQANVALVTEQLTEAFRKGDLSAFILNVRKNPDNQSRFQLVYGHLRLEAARRCGAKVLPAVITEINDPQMFWQLVKENEQRSNPSVVSLAFQVRFVVENFNWSYSELSRLYNRSEEMMSRLYQLSHAPKPFLEFVNEHEVFAHVVSEMVKLRLDQAQQEEILQLMLQPGITPGFVRKYLKSFNTPAPVPLVTLPGASNSKSKGDDIVEAEYFEYEEGDRLEAKYIRQEEKLPSRPVKLVDGGQSSNLSISANYGAIKPTSPKQTKSLYSTFTSEDEDFSRENSLFTPMTAQERLIIEKLEADVRQIEQLAGREDISDEFRLKLVEIIQRFTKI